MFADFRWTRENIIWSSATIKRRWFLKWPRRFLMELDLTENHQSQLYYYGYYRGTDPFIESIIRPRLCHGGCRHEHRHLYAPRRQPRGYLLFLQASPARYLCGVAAQHRAEQIWEHYVADAPSQPRGRSLPSSSMKTLARTTPADRVPSSVAGQEGRTKFRSRPSIPH